MTQEHCAPVVGLVGGIGSGKSAVARWVSRNASVAVIDGDEAGHRALTDPEVQQRVLARFPGMADGHDNAINRSRLAREIFGDNDTARVARSAADPAHAAGVPADGLLAVTVPQWFG